MACKRLGSNEAATNLATNLKVTMKKSSVTLEGKFFFSVRSCLEELFSKEYYSSKVLLGQ
jgi:hypothetical protein